MADLPELPALFLSHSGKEKDFVRRLYKELLHVNHNPFFDQDTRPDSLPKGTPFPSRIVEACRKCKLGVVVLSHNFFESMWPMFELQQFLFHNTSSPNNVYPIFFKLIPADLYKSENLARWECKWKEGETRWDDKNRDWQAESSSNFTSLTLDIRRWREAVHMLCHQSGDILPCNKDEHAFIQTIVSNICKRFPPPESFLMGDHFKGAEHIQEEIHELFQKQQHGDQDVDDSKRAPIAVGIYGVGGSGKTTVCRYMLNFYNKEYPGNCCFLQFPSKKADISLLVQSLRDVLSKRGNLSKKKLCGIQSVEEAKLHIQNLLKSYRVFLIVDNVWDWSLKIAKEIVMMDFMPGSRLLVTARSEYLLRILSSNLGFFIHIVHVPSISEQEAIGALMAYSMSSLQCSSNMEDLGGLARSCFHGERCYPLLLEVVGKQLRCLVRQAHTPQDWTRCISNLQARVDRGDEVIEDRIVDVLKTSCDALHLKLKDTFLKLGTCVPKKISSRSRSLSASTEWLSKVSDDGSHTIEDIRDQLMELEYHGLIQIHREEVVIHDLQKVLIENLVRKDNGVPMCYFLEGDIRTLSTSECRTKLRYVYACVDEQIDYSIFLPQKRGSKRKIGWFSLLPKCIEVLHLSSEYEGLSRKSLIFLEHNSLFSVKHMQFLRHLHLSGFNHLREVGGWHGAPLLVSVHIQCCRSLEEIESMTCLLGLESVVLNYNGNGLILKGTTNLTEFLGHPILGHPRKLREVTLSRYKNNWADLQETLSAYTSLQKCILSQSEIVSFPNFNSSSLRVLDLSGSERLERMEGSLCGLTALEELDLSDCSELKSMPDLKQLVRLRGLELLGCGALREVKLGDAALTSLDRLSLQYGGCLLSTSSHSSPLLISAFTNLRSLEARGGSVHHEVMDVGSIELPVSLTDLDLDNFVTAQEFTGLSALVNLESLCLYRWNSLKRITALGGLTKLSYMCISKCASLREVGHWEPPLTRYNLETVRILNCPQLETLSRTITHLTSLQRLFIDPTVVENRVLPEDMEDHFRLSGKDGCNTKYERR